MAASRILSLRTVCHFTDNGPAPAPLVIVGGTEDSPKCVMVPESNISFKRVSTRFVSFALFFRLEVMGLFDSIPFVFGLTFSSAENEPDWVE